MGRWHRSGSGIVITPVYTPMTFVYEDGKLITVENGIRYIFEILHSP